MPTSKRTAIVTGAAQGIGEAIALRLAQDGLNVVVSDLPAKREQLDSLAKRIEATGQRAIVVGCNVSEEKDVVAMVDKAVSTFGGLDVVWSSVLHHRDYAHLRVFFTADGRQRRHRNVQAHV